MDAWTTRFRPWKPQGDNDTHQKEEADNGECVPQSESSRAKAIESREKLKADVPSTNYKLSLQEENKSDENSWAGEMLGGKVSAMQTGGTEFNSQHLR